MEGKKLPSQSSISRCVSIVHLSSRAFLPPLSRHQTEQDLKSFSRDLIFTDNDDSQKVLEEEANALAQFNKVRLHPSSSSSSSSFNLFRRTKIRHHQRRSHNRQEHPVETISVRPISSLSRRRRMVSRQRSVPLFNSSKHSLMISSLWRRRHRKQRAIRSSPRRRRTPTSLHFNHRRCTT